MLVGSFILFAGPSCEIPAAYAGLVAGGWFGPTWQNITAAEYLKVLVTSLLVEKPPDPFQWMREQLEGDLAKWASIGYMHIYIYIVYNI